MSATHSNCLNCGHTLHGKFCSNCGQKADTHRITLKHFITHDLIHGVWHVDKGLFFTVKEAVIRPGRAALNYIIGKRVIYYNIFYLSLLVLGLNLLVLHYFLQTSTFSFNSSGDMKAIGGFLENNVKLILLMFIPVFSLVGVLVFMKNKLNFAEHSIIAGFLFCGMTILGLINNLLKLFPPAVTNIFEYSLFPVIDIILLLLPVWTYYKAVGAKYKAIGFIWRIIVFYILVILLYLIILITVLLIYNYALTGHMDMEGELMLQ